MSHLQMSTTRIIPSAWDGISQEQNDAQSMAIYGVIAKHGGDVKVTAYSAVTGCLLSIIAYPDEQAAMRSVADVWALRTLEFVSVEGLWDIGEWTSIVRAASAAVA